MFLMWFPFSRIPNRFLSYLLRGLDHLNYLGHLNVLYAGLRCTTDFLQKKVIWANKQKRLFTNLSHKNQTDPEST